MGISRCWSWRRRRRSFRSGSRSRRKMLIISKEPRGKRKFPCWRSNMRSLRRRQGRCGKNKRRRELRQRSLSGRMMSRRERTSLRKSWRNSMLCYLMKGSNVLKRGKRIGLRKEDASGCKRRGMKSRDVETKLLKEKEKRGRQEKLRRDKEELRKRKRDVLILKKLNRRKEKKKGRLRTDLQDKKRKKEKRCRTGGT